MLPDDLYALPPEDFTAARTAAVKAAKAAGDAAGSKLVAAQRRPSTSAWVVNRFTRRSPDLLAQLLTLGRALAAAQAAGQADELRELGLQRRKLVAAVTDAAVAHAGRPVTAAVQTEVAQTLEAALTDPASADAVRSGRLVRALSFAGFGGVELTGAVAAPLTTAAKDKAPRRGGRKPDAAAEGAESARRQLAAAEQAALTAAGELDDAVRGCEQAEQAWTTARRRAADAQQEVEHQSAALDEATARQRAADDATMQAEATAACAVEQVAAAQVAGEAARTALDRLRRS